MAVRIAGARVLVTGANRGLGSVFARTLVARGAGVVYAGARDPAQVTIPGVEPVRLDITSAEDVAAAAVRCADIDILINNAGLMRFAPVLAAPGIDAAREEMETNYFGTLRMCRAFAPILAAGGGGALVNMLSIVSWFANPLNSSYCASKSVTRAYCGATSVALSLVISHIGDAASDGATDTPTMIRAIASISRHMSSSCSYITIPWTSSFVRYCSMVELG